FIYLCAVCLGIFGTSVPPVMAAGPSATVLVYPASYFTGVELNTAYDMVTRLPGFVFSDTDTSKRGFAGSLGNVFVDGTPPAAKTDILSDILARIPAAQVERIEVIRGGAPRIDMQGLSVVANVVLKHADHTHVIATVLDTVYGDGHQGPGASVEFNRQRGKNSYDLTLTRINTLEDDSAGNGIGIIAFPDGRKVIDGSHRRGAEKAGYGLNGSLSRPLAQGSFGANLTLEETTYDSRVFYDAPGAADFPQSKKVRDAELGANWDRQFGAIELNLVGLQRFERDRNFNASIGSGVDQVFAAVSDTAESILRLTLRSVRSPALMIESGFEGAYNLLDGHSRFLSGGAAILLPGANPQVNEKRGEAFAQATWRMDANWSLEAGARLEYSALAAASVPTRHFAYFKPRLLLSWDPNDSSEFRARVERVIGQLDFSNFIASSNFANNGVSAGNLRLVPDQHWQFEGDYEYHFWKTGAVSLGYTRELIADLVDYVPIGDGLDGPGNIPKAQSNTYDLELSLPLDRVGIKGGTLKPSLIWRDTHARDPVTGETRAISNTQNRTLQVSILEDIEAWHSSLDFSIQTPFERPYFRIAQVTYDRLMTPYFGFTWDYKPKPDWDLQVKLLNLVPYQFDVVEYNCAGPRNIAPLFSIQDEHTHSEPRLFLELRKTF
ncbi:MAG: TonB-dependent receptor plug domain-containing protein, partial [Rhizomicrobium sp.]